MQHGTQLGHYEILSAIGKGGMGEVWKARDTKLGREVAIKTLPPEFAQDADRLARFEREAKLLASLNHPNIAAIYGLEEHEGSRFLVLELVEGDTLADRLKRGAIPVEESLKLALQVAEALEAAHEKGVIHRDLKPANIKVTPDGKVKVLDFGLAKAFASEDADVNLSNSPTLSMQATQAGIILGTAAYMSPEQAKGLTADRRADVFSFGCVVFEMLAGRMAFRGELVTEIMASVINQEPDYTALQENLHPRIKELLRRCFEKQPKDRWQAVGDVRVEIEQVLADPTGLTKQPLDEVIHAAPQSKLPWLAAMVAIAVVGLVAGWSIRPPETRAISRFDYDIPQGVLEATGRNYVLAVSPNGSHVVYSAIEGLYLKARDELEARLIPDTDGASNPMFSPNGQWIGFFREDQLHKIAISGGPPVPLGPAQGSSASWGVDETILFANEDGVVRVSADDGTSDLIIQSIEGEQFDTPRFLQDDWILLTVATGPGNWDTAQIVVASVDGEQRIPLELTGGDARYVETTGHLVYALDDDLFAVPFDRDRLELTGGAVALEAGVRRGGLGAAANYGISEDGALVYLTGAGGGSRSILLVDRERQEEQVGTDTGNYYAPRISPTGDRVALEDRDILGRDDIVVVDLRTGIRTLLAPGSQEQAVNPVWTRDSTKVAYLTPSGYLLKNADGSGVAEPIFEESIDGGRHQFFTPDDDGLVFLGRGNLQVGIKSLDGNGGIVPLMVGQFRVSSLELSPDGNWMAYQSNESGDSEIIVSPFPDVNARRIPVSNAGGRFPVWAGEELFYLEPGPPERLMAVPVQTGSSFDHGDPEEVFEWNYFSASGGRTYDVTDDGQRFLVLKDAEAGADAEPQSPQIITVLNRLEELRERVPVP